MTAQSTHKLSVEDNIFLAKRNLVDSIWKEARLEGIAVTYPQTSDVMDGRVVPGLSLEDNLALNNLKQAWRYVLDEPHPIDFDALKRITFSSDKVALFAMQANCARESSASVERVLGRQYPSQSNAKPSSHACCR